MLQPAWITMAPDGHIWCHPNGHSWSADYSSEQMWLRAHFVHELVHVWQVQQRGSLVFRRPPFARYRYRIELGKPFAAYGIEQQASMVEEAYLLREGRRVAGRTLAEVAAVLPFGEWT